MCQQDKYFEEKKARPTDAIALLSGELDFSSTMDEIDSTEETRE